MVALTRSQTRKKREDEMSGEGVAKDVQCNTGISQPKEIVDQRRKTTKSRRKRVDLPPSVSQSPVPSRDETSLPLESVPNASKTLTEESRSLSPGPPDSSLNSSYGLSPASHPASDRTQSSSCILGAPPNSPDNSHDLSPASHPASEVTQSSPHIPSAPPSTPQPLYDVSQDVQSLPHVIQSPLQCLTSPPSTPLLSSSIFEDLSDATNSLPHTPEAPPNSPFSSPEGPSAPNNSFCTTVGVHSEVPNSPLQNVGSLSNSSAGLPASLTASPYRFDSMAEIPSSPPQVIQSASKGTEGPTVSVVGSQYLSESALELLSLVPEVSRSPAKGPDGPLVRLVTSPTVNVAESEPESVSPAVEVSQSPSMNQDGSPAGIVASSKVYVSESEPELPSSRPEAIQSIPNSPKGSPALAHSAYVSEAPLHDLDNQDHVPSSSNGSLVDTQISPRPLQQSSRVLSPAFGCDPSGFALPNHSVPHEMFDYSSDTPRDPPEQISSDRILWDASDTPREAPIVVRDLYPEHTSPEVKLEEVVTPNMAELQQNETQDQDGNRTPLTLGALNRFNTAQPDYMDVDSSADDDDLNDTKLTEFPRYARVGPRTIQDYRALGAAQQEAELMRDAAEAPKQPIPTFYAAQPEAESMGDAAEAPEQFIAIFYATQQEAESMGDAAEAPDQFIAKFCAVQQEAESIGDTEEGSEHQTGIESEFNCPMHEEDLRLGVEIVNAILDADIPPEIDIQQDTSERFKSSGKAAAHVESWIIQNLPPRAQDLLMYNRRDISSDEAATIFVFERQLMRTPIDERNPSLMCLRPGRKPISPIMTSQEHISNLEDENNFIINRFKKGIKEGDVKQWIEEMGEWFEEEEGCIWGYISMLHEEIRGVAVAYANGEQEDDEKASLLRRLSQYDPDGSPGPRFDIEHVVRTQPISGVRPGENDYPKEHRLLGTDYARNDLFKRLRREPEELPADNPPRRQVEGHQSSLPVLPVYSNLRVWPHHPARFWPHRPEHHSGQEGFDRRPDINVNVSDTHKVVTHKRRRSDVVGDGHYDDDHECLCLDGVVVGGVLEAWMPPQLLTCQNSFEGNSRKR
ncbi:hypothetical protein P167DRAFT_577896 [Morchella conica CCBAS932]|uniref:Uncharacterized protein n=1 Tax=Morchella conica CCBAS932 TaxID=1392247 RepID=A0A3N4KSV6_9PEZI|nr:hypothetical protein P167DRAFT_577896 [Morchella conica CCBAS932]